MVVIRLLSFFANSSLMCVKENAWTKVMKFFKKVFKKDKINKDEEKEVLVAKVRTKEELMEIYNKAKKNEYDKIRAENIYLKTELANFLNGKTKKSLSEFMAENKAKKNEYDISCLELEEIKMLNELIEEEIKLKTEKLAKIKM